MVDRVLGALGETVRVLAYIAGLVFLIAAVSHGLTWVLLRRRTARWVWNYWNLLGSVLIVTGVAALGYAWLVLGFQNGAGGAMASLGLLLASAGLWMIVPV